MQPQDVARYLKHYIDKLAPWYDLSDHGRLFATKVPQQAVNRPLLFSAIIAFAAIHISLTSVATVRTAANFYHSRCIKLLIALSEAEVQAADGVPLAAACLLRSYEILAEDADPNRHLSGAYALAANVPIAVSERCLLRAGFFNYLREDITFSLMNRQPLKIDTSSIPTVYDAVEDEDHLNVISLHLARIINEAFATAWTDSDRTCWYERLLGWKKELPEHLTPFS